ncbi:MAG: hypothetical protein KatS3mg002_0938 [Candidatus Woesearchaeota archaeon]|nr:MAG: hypothetical protein KatS3mg002_0938 [Candidatus Woesearchaeota archaeon]
MESLEKSLEEAWNDTRKLFCYPPLENPVLTNEINTAAINMEDHLITINSNFVEYVINRALSNNVIIDPKVILKGLLHHEVNHYMYCPYDFSTLLKLEKQIGEVANDSIVHDISNYFSDVVINLDLMIRKKRKEVSVIYTHMEKRHPLDILLCGLYQDITKDDFKIGPLDDDLKDRLNKLKQIDYFDKDNWGVSAKIFAYIVKDLLEKEGKNDMLNIDNWGASSYSDEEIEKGIEEIAGNSDISDFKEILIISGIDYESLPEKVDTLYYDQQSKKYLMNVSSVKFKGNSFDSNEHKKYEISDSYSTIDVFNSYGKFMPGFSQVWKSVDQTTSGNIDAVPDLVIALDTSSSMINPKTNLSPAVLGAFCAAKLYLDKQSYVATYNFSSEVYITEFSREREKIFDNLAFHQNGGTYVDLPVLSSLVNSAKSKADLIMITDMQIDNYDEFMNYLRSIEKTNRINILWIDPTPNTDLSSIISKNFNVYKIYNQNDIPKIIIGECGKNG